MSSALVPDLSWTNPVHNIQLYSSRIQFTLSSHLLLFLANGVLPVWLSHKNHTRILSSQISVCLILLEFSIQMKCYQCYQHANLLIVQLFSAMMLRVMIILLGCTSETSVLSTTIQKNGI